MKSYFTAFLTYLDNLYIMHSKIQEDFLIQSHLSVVPVGDNQYFKKIIYRAFNFSFWNVFCRIGKEFKRLPKIHFLIALVLLLFNSLKNYIMILQM